jgi:hypothetical protein
MSELVWMKDDARRARRQGWQLNNNRNDIIRVAYRIPLHTSQEARAFVEAQADKGDPLALKALAIIAREAMSPSLRYEDVSYSANWWKKEN